MKTLRLSLIMLLSAAILTPRPTLAQANLLANGDLDSIDGSGLANSWSRWWEEIPKPTDGTYNYAAKPDWGPETVRNI
jgi:hypothetical protein